MKNGIAVENGGGTVQKAKKKSQALAVWNRYRKSYTAMIGLVLLVLLTLGAIFADQIAPYGYDDQNYSAILEGVSAEHLMGTDNVGRDIFSRVLHGARISLTVGLLSVTMSVVIGGVMGALAAYYGGVVDNALMRFIDACGCEVEYDGYVIHLRKHRGSTVRKPLMDGENVTNLSVTIDGRENTAAYEISLFKMADLQAGDEVNITYTPMGIQADTRIVNGQTLGSMLLALPDNADEAEKAIAYIRNYPGRTYEEVQA